MITATTSSYSCPLVYPRPQLAVGRHHILVVGDEVEVCSTGESITSEDITEQDESASPIMGSGDGLGHSITTLDSSFNSSPTTTGFSALADLPTPATSDDDVVDGFRRLLEASLLAESPKLSLVVLDTARPGTPLETSTPPSSSPVLNSDLASIVRSTIHRPTVLFPDSPIPDVHISHTPPGRHIATSSSEIENGFHSPLSSLTRNITSGDITEYLQIIESISPSQLLNQLDIKHVQLEQFPTIVTNSVIPGARAKVFNQRPIPIPSLDINEGHPSPLSRLIAGGDSSLSPLLDGISLKTVQQPIPVVIRESLSVQSHTVVVERAHPIGPRPHITLPPTPGQWFSQPTRTALPIPQTTQTTKVANDVLPPSPPISEPVEEVSPRSHPAPYVKYGCEVRSTSYEDLQAERKAYKLNKDLQKKSGFIKEKTAWLKSRLTMGKKESESKTLKGVEFLIQIRATDIDTERRQATEMKKGGMRLSGWLAKRFRKSIESV